MKINKVIKYIMTKNNDMKFRTEVITGNDQYHMHCLWCNENCGNIGYNWNIYWISNTVKEPSYSIYFRNSEDFVSFVMTFCQINLMTSIG